MATDLKATEFVTQPVRLAFPALFEPKPVMKGEEKTSYQATLLIPPTVDMAPFYAAMKAAIKEKWGDSPPKLSAGRGNPIKDAGDADYGGFEEGWKFIRTSSKFPPTVVDQARNEIIDKAKVYAGCWVRVHINAYAWEHTSGKGVSFSLNAVQLVKDDERIDGRRSAEELFEPIGEVDGGNVDASTGDELFA